jgi:RNA polymerase sigma-70 factor (ECF subfamily)
VARPAGSTLGAEVSAAGEKEGLDIAGRWSSHVERNETTRNIFPGGSYVLGVPRVYIDVDHRETPSDRELLAQSRGCGDGFGEFYRRHRAAVLAFHGARTREPELAADLTAETFAAALVVVHDRAQDLPAHPVAWLFAIANAKFVDSYRRGRVEADARRRLALDRVMVDDDDIERIGELIGSTDFLAHIEERLSPEQFHALRAHVVDERRYADIADELRCSPEVVRMRVNRALKVLRRAGLEASDG